MQSYYDLMKLPHEEAELLVGEEIDFEGCPSTIISLDEYWTENSGFATKYTVLQVFMLRPYKQEKAMIKVYVPGIDDTNFGVCIEPALNKSMSDVIVACNEFMARNNHRNINLTAFQQYLCVKFGVRKDDVDWN